jgi:hypothetical protein
VIPLLEAQQCPLNGLVQTAPDLNHLGVNGGIALCKCLVHFVSTYKPSRWSED